MTQHASNPRQSVNLHQTVTFEGRSTNWATAPQIHNLQHHHFNNQIFIIQIVKDSPEGCGSKTNMLQTFDKKMEKKNFLTYDGVLYESAQFKLLAPLLSFDVTGKRKEEKYELGLYCDVILFQVRIPWWLSGFASQNTRHWVSGPRWSTYIKLRICGKLSLVCLKHYNCS